MGLSFDIEFWIQMGVYVGSFGYVYGTLTTRMKYMEDKLDKHNSFQDRLVIVEQSDKALHSRLDNQEEHQGKIHDRLDEFRTHIMNCPK